MVDKEIQQREEIQQLLDRVSALTMPATMSLRYVHIDECIEQDLNAQAMPQQMFNQLVENIRSAGAPETTPLLAQTEKGLEIVSGHHRLRATRAAGIEWLVALVYEDLSRARIHSKQLAHNSIHGYSDPALVQKIWERIDDAQARFEAFIDPRLFDDIPKSVSFTPVDVDFMRGSKVVYFVFLPTQHEDFHAAVEFISDKFQKDTDLAYIEAQGNYEKWLTAFLAVRHDMDVYNGAAILTEMSRLAMERLDQLAAEAEAEEQQHDSTDTP